MAIANLGLRFIVEVVGVAALAYSGFQLSDSGVLRVVAAIAAPLVLVVTWALIVAPNAANGLSQANKDIIGTMLLLAAAIALASAGQLRLAIGFAAVVLVNAALLFVFGEDPRRSLGGMGRTGGIGG